MFPMRQSAPLQPTWVGEQAYGQYYGAGAWNSPPANGFPSHMPFIDNRYIMNQDSMPGTTTSGTQHNRNGFRKSSSNEDRNCHASLLNSRSCRNEAWSQQHEVHSQPFRFSPPAFIPHFQSSLPHPLSRHPPDAPFDTPRYGRYGSVPLNHTRPPHNLPQSFSHRNPRSNMPKGPRTPQYPHPQNYGNHEIHKSRRKKGKAKTSARDKKSCVFYCDTCDRGYNDASQFEEHNNSHIKCSVDGCKYIAVGKLVKLHYNQQHRTGVASKIWQLESSEDIEKWKEERRRNFPTSENIARKQTIEEEKVNRGEVLQNEPIGKMRMNGGKQPLVTSFNVKRAKITDEDVERMVEDESQVVGAPDGLKNVLEDDVAQNDFQRGCRRRKRRKISAKRSNKQANRDTNTSMLNNTKTLLQKLLASDIRHERNVILQCVRYIVRNNFFTPDTGETAPDTGETAPDTGETAPDTGETAADTGETAADTGETAADTGETAPDTGETAPDTGETAPDTGETAPDTGETAPDTGETAPDTGETAPDTGETAPDTGETAPDTGETAPDTGETAPDTGETAPDTGETAPDTGEPSPPPEMTTTMTP